MTEQLDTLLGWYSDPMFLQLPVATLLLMFYPVWAGVAAAWFLVPALLLTGWLCSLAWKFRLHRERPQARKLFFCTLMYLPAVLILTVMAWR